MKVSTTQPFQIIYSLYQLEFLGNMLQPYIVQLDQEGRPTLLSQNISVKNVREFAAGLDETDFELVRLLESMQKDAILKKFNPKKAPSNDFLLRVYDPEKGDKAIQEAIHGYLENYRAKIFPKLLGKEVYISSNDGNPAWKKVNVRPDEATVLFHLYRNEENTHYFPTIRYGGEKVDFQYKNALLLCEEPAWLLVGSDLYHFEGNLDGKKLRPFFEKKFIPIPRKVEEQYFQKFVTPLIAAHDVRAKGFDIIKETLQPVPVLTLSEHTVQHQQTLFAGTAADEKNGDPARQTELSLILSFSYGSFSFRFDGDGNGAHVSMEKNGDNYVFHKVRRDFAFEKSVLKQLRQLDLPLRNGAVHLDKLSALSWLQAHADQLGKSGIEIRQQTSDQRKYFIGVSSMDVSINENEGTDWFDIHVKVRFGAFEIPFLRLREHILRQKTEFVLPNGEIAIIPEWWFSKFSELFALLEPRADHGLALRKHHLMLVQELDKESLASVVISRRLEKLRDFEALGAYPVPAGFRGTLRPYQKAGYDWLRFLNEYRFGGCLADDMGLGKTVQTLSLLQHQKEEGHPAPSLLIMPTSLLYNWALEAEKFTPDLRVMSYTGTGRFKSTAPFGSYDLILTSYGIARLDIDILKAYRFNYVILDESQAIKNPASIISKAVMQLQSAHRLILTGTPLENSTMDLWTQMTFANPGLLGSQNFFRKQYLVPIEKQNDEPARERLHHLIKPFILRRHKSQVATDLPEKIESVHFSTMSEAQEKYYEETKSKYRNLILEQIDREGMAKSQIAVLQGLIKLRQIANHPRLEDATYPGDSGKFRDVMHKLETAVQENHKILIFSQFVKHLELFRQRLEGAGIPYTYLDGATRDRHHQVDAFQSDSTVKVFLISLKAGGVGLNLTAADYVFILDPWWNPAAEAQAIDRAHRIGQDKTVFTYKFITKNTVEEKILSLQKHKRQLADDLISTEESFVKSLTRQDVLLLLE